MGWVSALLLLVVIGEVWTCIQDDNKILQSDLCRAKQAGVIVYAKVVAIYKNHRRVRHKYANIHLEFERYSALVEPLCDRVSGTMQLEMPRGRFILTGLGDFSCHAYTVMENNTYFFFVRYDKNHNLVPDGINGQHPIFPDTPKNKKMFFSHFQFSNCVSGTNHQTYSPEWERQEDKQLPCPNKQNALYEEEEYLREVRMLNQKVKTPEKSINHLREKVKGTKRSLRQVKKESKREAMLMKQQPNK